MDQRFFIFSTLAFLCLSFHGSMSMNTRVVGGSKVNIKVIPFMLSLRLNGEHVCGAAIIDRNWGVTAAHCILTGLENIQYSVRSGSSFKDTGGKITNVTNIIVHELYDDLNSNFDIAVFKVKKPFKYGRHTQAIDLPGSEQVDDDWGIIAGWGYYTLKGNVLSEHLRSVSVPKVERARCSKDYSGRFDVTPFQVCYGYEQGGKDACKGDSGGPLFTNSNILLGVTSWGGDCGEPHSPGVYTSIFLMLDWIYDKTGVKSQL